MGGPDTPFDGKEDRDKHIELANTYFFKGRKSLTKGHHDVALRMFRASIAIQENVYGTYHKRTARSYFFLAQTLSKHTQEFDKALTAYRRTLRLGFSLDGDHNYVQAAKRGARELLVEKKTYSEKDIEVFFTSITESIRLEKEGLDHVDKNNYQDARDAFEKCLVIEEKAEGTFPLDLGHLYIRVAEVYINEGEHQMAINAYRSALSIYKSALGVEHADSIFCLQGIKSSLYEMEYGDSVIEEYAKSIFRSLHHCETGDALIESKMIQQAIDEYETACSIEENSLGKYPLTVSGIRKKIGLAFQSMKEYDRALIELRTALSINIFECGEDHQSVVTTMQDIRSVMGEKGYEFSAINKYMNTVAFSVKHERYGEHLLLEKRDFAVSIEEFQKSLALEVSALGKYHLTQGGLFKAIGDAFLKDEMFDFAIVNYRNALTIYQPILGTHHDSTRSVLTSIGNAALGSGLDTDEMQEYRDIVSESIAIEKMAENYIKDGADSEAIAAYRVAVRKEGSFLGDYHLSIADLHAKIAEVLKRLGRYDSAIASHRCILAINLKSLGTEHLNTEKAHEDLVNVSLLKGLKKEDSVSYGQNAKISIEHEDNGDEAMVNQKYQSAITYYKNALDIEEFFLGSDHLVIEGLLRKIVKCHKLLGKNDRAFQFYRKIIRIYMMYESPDYDPNCMLQRLETAVHDLGLSQTQQMEYIDIVRESVKCEMDGDFADQSKNYVQAIDQYSRCLLMEQSLLGMLHPSIWPVYKKMGSTFEKKGDVEMSIISHGKALAILESYIGMKEKETIETYNDLLSATLRKISCISDMQQVKSGQDHKSTISTSPSVEKSKIKVEQHKNAALLGRGKEFDEIYEVFTSLKNDISVTENNRGEEKKEMLEALARNWHEYDGNETIMDINLRGLIKENESTFSTGQLMFLKKKKDFKQSGANRTFDGFGIKNIIQQEDKLVPSDTASPSTTADGTKMRRTNKGSDYPESNMSSFKPSIDWMMKPNSKMVMTDKTNAKCVQGNNDVGNRGIKSNAESMKAIENERVLRTDEVRKNKNLPEERITKNSHFRASGSRTLLDPKLTTSRVLNKNHGADAAERATGMGNKLERSKSEHVIRGSRMIDKSKGDNVLCGRRNIGRSKSDHRVSGRMEVGKLIERFNNNSAHERTPIDSETAPQLKDTPTKEGGKPNDIAMSLNELTNIDTNDGNDSIVLQDTLAKSSDRIDHNLKVPETPSLKRTNSEKDTNSFCNNASSCSDSSSTSSSPATSYASLWWQERS